MKNTLDRHIALINKVLGAIPTALLFLMPLFFLSTTTEFFEFNKLYLLLIATLLMVILLIAKIALGGQLEIVKSKVDLPLFALIITVILASIFSLNKTISIFGSQSRWFPSLLGVTVLLAYYYIATAATKKLSQIKDGLLALITSGTISSLVAILSYYGMHLGQADYLKTTNFTLAGSGTTAVVVAAICVTAAVVYSLYTNKLVVKVLLTLAAIVNFTLVLLVGISVGWAVLVIGVLSALMFVKQEQVKASKIQLLSLTGVVLALIIFAVVPTTRNKFINSNYPKEIVLPLQASWVIASSTIQDYPLLATGPSTFGLNFTRYRPLSLNSTPYWDLRFDRPYNEIIDILSTLGLVGIVVAIFLGYSVIKLALKAKDGEDKSGVIVTLSVAVLASLVAFLFTYATVLNSFIFFGIMSMLVAAQAITSPKEGHVETITLGITTFSSVPSIFDAGVVKKEYIRYVFTLPFLAAALYIGFISYKIYAAEYYMRQSVLTAQKNDGARTYAYQQQAITENPSRDSYMTSFAQTNMMLANAIAAKQNLSDNDKQTVQALISDSIKSIRTSTEVLNPLDVYNWEVRAAIYKNLIGVAQDADTWAISAYTTAIQLDPTNARLRVELGGIYYAKQDYLSAANQFKQATALKTDYANAHYNLAEALLKLNDTQSAKTELETTASLVDAKSSDYQKVEDELAAINTSPTVAGASTSATKPTVEQLSNQGQQPAQNQGPLQNAGEQNSQSEQNVTPTPTPTPTPNKKK